MIKYVQFSKGHDGSILYPGIVELSKNPNLYLTKIGASKDIENEHRIYQNLPDEFNGIIYNKECYIKDFCKDDYLLDETCLNRIEEKRKLNIIYDKMITIRRFFGHNLSEIINNKVITERKDIYYILRNMLLLYACLDKLNSKYYIFHRDITCHNILYDINSKKICLVDFIQSRQYFPPKSKPHHLPNKDLDDLISVTNTIIDYSNKTYNSKIKPITNIMDLEKNKEYYKKQLK